MYKCEICGKEFDTKFKLGGHKSSHSRLGKKRSKEVKEKVFCKNCGSEVTRRRSIFCSKECFREYKRTHTFYKGMDITVADLRDYRIKHQVCEICGRKETMKNHGVNCNLAVDHDHATNKFRGLLCYSCNTKLSWYENWKDNIEKYLSK